MLKNLNVELPSKATARRAPHRTEGGGRCADIRGLTGGVPTDWREEPHVHRLNGDTRHGLRAHATASGINNDVTIRAPAWRNPKKRHAR